MREKVNCKERMGEVRKTGDDRASSQGISDDDNVTRVEKVNSQRQQYH